MVKLTAEQVADGLFRAAGIAIAAGKNNVATGMLSAMEMIRENLIESPDERRERFERWYRHDCETRRGIFNRSMARDMRGVGEYRDENIETAWQAFNAALDFGGGGDA